MREFDLLEGIFAANASLRRRFPGRVTIPPGDDMAGLRLGGGELLVAVDQVIAGRHFVPGTPWPLVARKALCRNLSDIAAMAARPVACVAAAALPPAMPDDDVRALYEALRSTAEAFDCPLVGGDTATLEKPDDPAVLSVTVLADLPPGVSSAVRRDGARPGDGLYVTGALGGSLAADGMGRHLTFEPRLNEAVDLARMLGERLHAMIDLSDGIARDAGHLAALSRVVIRIDAERLPCTDGATWRQALADGEDYELCFAAAGPVPGAVRGVPITRVGQVHALSSRTTAPALEVRHCGRPIDLRGMGWEHRSMDAP